MTSRFFALVAALLCVFSQMPLAASCPNCPECEQIKQEAEQKIYISADQIIIEDNRLYCLIENKLIPLPSVQCDEAGLFVSKSTINRGLICKIGHEVKCFICFGCEDYSCQYRCRCRG